MSAASSPATTIEPHSPSDCESFSTPTTTTSAIDKSSADGLVEVTVECLAGEKADEDQWIHQLTHLHQSSDCMSETSSVEDIRERLDTLFASYPASSSSTDPPSNLTSPHWSVRTLVNSSGPAPRPRNRDSITTTTTSSSHDIERSHSSLSNHKIRLVPSSLSVKESSRLIPSNRSTNKYGPAPTAPPTRSLPLPPVIAEIDTQQGGGDESGARRNKSSITFPLPPPRSSSPATSHRSNDTGGKRSTDSNSKNRGRTVSQEHKQSKREQLQKSISSRRRSRSRGNGSEPSHKERKDQARLQSSLAAAAKIYSHRSPNSPSSQTMDHHRPGSKSKAKPEALRRLDTQNIHLDGTLSQCSTTDDHSGYQTWKVSSDNIDDDEGDNDVFSQTFGSPVTEKHPSPFGTPSPRLEAEGAAQHFQRMHRNITPPKINSPRGPLLLSDEQRHGEEMSVSNATAAIQGGRTGNSHPQATLSPFSTVNSSETTVHRPGAPAMRGRELKLAHLRAQQQLLLLEQQRLEQQDSDIGSPDSGVDTEMMEPNETFPGDRAHDQHRDFVGGVVGNWTKVQQEAPSSRSVTSPSTSSRKLEKQVPRAQAPPPQDDRAVEYEVSALRAQVAQLQFALKRQMNDGSSRGYRGVPNNESMGLPTPDQSFSGGSVYDGKAYNPSVGTFGAPVFGGGNSERQQSMYPYTTSAGSFMDEILQHQSRQGHVQTANSRQASNGASSNRTAVPTRYDSSVSARNDHSFALSALRNAQNGSQFYSEPSLADEGFSNRSGDVRVDELSAKLERLEELFRMSALNGEMMRSASPTMDRRTSLATPTPTQDGAMSRQPAVSHQHHQLQHPAQIHEEQRSGQYGPVRSSSISSASATSSRGGKGVGGSTTMGTDFSVGTRSPAASAFMFNATPYPRSGTLPVASGAGGSSEGSHNIHHQYHHSATISALNLRSGDDAVGKNRLTTSSGSVQNNDGSPAGRDTRPIAAVPRKGVARFILGTTAKLADATDGKEVPSVQVSWSRKRSERIEKPKTKVKAAGRGRVIVVKDDKK